MPHWERNATECVPYSAVPGPACHLRLRFSATPDSPTRLDGSWSIPERCIPDFRLDTYGPFDADVLNDLETAQSFQSLHVKTGIYPSGYGYEVKTGAKGESTKERVTDWLASHQSDLTWAVKDFAARSASELELLATIVYVDRELAGKPTSRPLRYLAQRACVS